MLLIMMTVNKVKTVAIHPCWAWAITAISAPAAN